MGNKTKNSQSNTISATPMDKEIQSFQFIFTGQQYLLIC